MSSATDQFGDPLPVTWSGECDKCDSRVSVTVVGITKETQHRLWARCANCKDITALDETEVPRE
jgi:hypothetical protein